MIAADDQAIYLWGEPTQVTAARGLLQKLISKTHQPSMKKKTEWAKIMAHNVNREAGVDWKERREFMLQSLRNEPESPSAFPEKV